MVSLHAWPGGLAVAVQGPAHRALVIFGPDGWRRSEPRVVFPDGPPAGTESVTLAVPEWLADQLALLDMPLGGAHTDFIRLDRLLSRLHRQSANAVVLVLGSRPAVVVLLDGRMQVLEPAVPTGASPMPILASAAGWIAVFAGRVVVPVAEHLTPEKPAEEAPEPAVTPPVEAVTAGAVQPATEPATPTEPEITAPPEPEPAHASEPAGEPTRTSEPERGPSRGPEPAREPVRTATPVGAPSADERFVVSSSVAAAIPDDVAAEISLVAGAGALSVVPRLDGSQTVAEIAASTGVGRDQVLAVIRLLLARKLAFRYVSRVRPATGAKVRN